MATARRRGLGLAILLGLIYGLHGWAPVGVGSWHWVHLLAQQLFLVPLLLAAAWFRGRGVVAVTSAVILLTGLHELVAWRGFALLQQAHGVQVLSYVAVAAVGWHLFEQKREAQRVLEAAHADTLLALARSLELRERYTQGHSERVRAYALILAEAHGIRDEAWLNALALGAMLHDVGKLGIPDAVLLKPGPLTAEEWAVMRRHPDLGADLVGAFPFLREAGELVRCHHERFDGAGYPRGLRGEAIPLGARCFAIADALDALTTDRPYRRALGFGEAALVLGVEAGAAYDPALLAAFCRVPFETWREAAAAHGVVLLP